MLNNKAPLQILGDFEEQVGILIKLPFLFCLCYRDKMTNEHQTKWSTSTPILFN